MYIYYLLPKYKPSQKEDVPRYANCTKSIAFYCEIQCGRRYVSIMDTPKNDKTPPYKHGTEDKSHAPDDIIQVTSKCSAIIKYESVVIHPIQYKIACLVTKYTYILAIRMT